MKIDIYKTSTYFIFLLFLFYSFRGIFIPNQATIVYVLQGSILFFELIYLICSLKYLNHNVVMGFFFFFLLNFIYYLLTEFMPNLFSINSNLSFANISLLGIVSKFSFTILSFFPAFYLSKKGKITERNLIFFFNVFFLLAIIGFFSASNQIRDIKDSDEFTNNEGYRFVLLLPFIFLVSNKKYSILFLFVSLIFTLISAKRGAIVILSVFLIYYFFQEYIIESGRYFYRNIFLLMILILLVSAISYYMYSNNEYLQFRLEKTLEGDSSGRDMYYTMMWNRWSSDQNSIFDYLFGFGMAASVKITHLFAHNDWLELLTMSGLFGISIYILLFITVIKFYSSKFFSRNEKKIIMSILIIWFLRTLFSMGFVLPDIIPLYILLGYMVGKHMNKNNNII